MDRTKNEFVKSGIELLNIGQSELLIELCCEYLKKACDEQVHVLLANAYLLSGDVNKAEQTARSAMAIYPSSAELLLVLGDILRTKGQLSNAARLYIRAGQMGIDEISAICKEELGIILQQLGRTEVELTSPKQAKRVLVIAPIFPPTGGSGVWRSLKLVKYLRFYGLEPIVLTFPAHDKAKYTSPFFDELPVDLEIIRAAIPKNNDKDLTTTHAKLYKQMLPPTTYKAYNELLTKAKDAAVKQSIFLYPDSNITWAISTAQNIETCIDMSDIEAIYTTSGPYSCHFAGYLLKTRYPRLPWVADFRDEWSNNPFIWQGIDKKNYFGYKLCVDFEKAILRKADAVICVVESALDSYYMLGAEKPKMFCITNGYDEEDFESIGHEEAGSDKFTIVHNGLLYGDRSPVTMLNAIANLVNQGKIESSKIKFHMGSFEGYPDYERLTLNDVARLNLEDIAVVSPYMAHLDSIVHANQADMLLLILGPAKAYGHTYTGKLFEYLRLGKPILCLGPDGGAVDKLLRKTGNGVNIEFNDIPQIECHLLDAYKAWEKGEKKEFKSDVTMYERKHLTGKHAQIFNTLIQKNTDL